MSHLLLALGRKVSQNLHHSICPKEFVHQRSTLRVQDVFGVLARICNMSSFSQIVIYITQTERYHISDRFLCQEMFCRVCIIFFMVKLSFNLV